MIQLAEGVQHRLVVPQYPQVAFRDTETRDTEIDTRNPQEKTHERQRDKTTRQHTQSKRDKDNKDRQERDTHRDGMVRDWMKESVNRPPYISLALKRNTPRVPSRCGVVWLGIGRRT